MNMQAGFDPVFKSFVALSECHIAIGKNRRSEAIHLALQAFEGFARHDYILSVCEAAIDLLELEAPGERHRQYLLQHLPRIQRSWHARRAAALLGSQILPARSDGVDVA
jgi:hypothetical protein